MLNFELFLLLHLKHRIRYIFVFILLCCSVYAQDGSNKRSHVFVLRSDTLTIDSLSLIPNSQTIFNQNTQTIIDSACFAFDYINAKIIFKRQNSSCPSIGDSIRISYRVFPVFFSQPLRRKELQRIEKSFGGLYNPNEYKSDESASLDIFKLDGLSKSGSISRGITFGNNQDAVVNSSLNLQLAGKVSDNIEILAAITDNNIPVQPEGNTQQLQDFDKVYIQLSSKKNKLIAGDFELTKPNSYFMNFYKKNQGGVFSTEFNLGKETNGIKPPLMRMAFAAAVSKGKFSRNTFNGTEANQGPYRLKGAENETFIIILSGSENVYIDGQLMTRGEQNDYVIDYNTAEIIFTAKRLITKDSRIIIEFQYSDKNYARTLLFFNDEFENQKLKLKLNVYSEQDTKNQPLLQDLSDEQKSLLTSIGDSIQNALTPSYDTAAFNSTEILYYRTDTTATSGNTYPGIFVYTTDSTRLLFRVNFSFVGQGKGDYAPAVSNANGKVYQWVEPVGGIPQGSYAPVRLLATPKQQQMLTLGGEYAIDKQSKVFMEAAVSRYDVNLFSDFDKRNDAGFAVNGGASRLFNLNTKKEGWKLNTILNFEHVDKNFKPIEPYRNAEFTRDWNLTDITGPDDENAGNITIGLLKNQQLINYQLRTFLKGNQYNGYMNAVNGNLVYGTYKLSFNGSYLLTGGDRSKTHYLRDQADFSKSFKAITIGYNQENERNKIFVVGTDSLQLTSFGHDVGKIYLQSTDTTKLGFRLEASRRYDFGIKWNDFKLSTTADVASLNIDLLKNPNNRLSTNTTYRILEIDDTTLTAIKSEKSLLNRIDHQLILFKGGITISTYYEIGTGQELKQTYAFVKVTAGTGVYEWNDYNGDGIAQLNEFEIASFSDRAEYIKVYTPTNDFVKSHTNKLNEVVNLNPAAFLNQDKPWKKTMSRFANQTSLRFDNKTLSDDLAKSLNPFTVDVNDTNLITTNSSLRNTFFYNRSSSVFSTDISWQQNNSKVLLSNGFETRKQNSYSANTRWNITRALGLNMNGETGRKLSNSAFQSRSFDVDYYILEPKFSIQPGTVFRTTFNYQYKNKRNILGDIGEKTEWNTAGVEIKFSDVKKGSVSARFSFIHISYNAGENTAVSFEMLEGYKQGKNMTWNLTLQKSLSNSLQLDINYDGRKSEGTGPVHTAGVQVRAYF